MGDFVWEYREATWHITSEVDVDVGWETSSGWLYNNGALEIVPWNSNVDNTKEPDYLDFITWLNHQCEDGWELFKIHRQSNWCLFRIKKG